LTNHHHTRTLRTGAVVCAAFAVLAARGAGQTADLPDRDTFLNDAREALLRSQQVWHRYAYKERRTELHTNPFGRLGTGDTLVTEVRPAPDPRLTYRRLLERNGAALSKAHLDRQDAEYRSRIARVVREDVSSDAERRQRDDQLARRRAQLVMDDVVNTLQFDLVRREFPGGTPAIVVSFAAKPNARPATKEGRLARAFKGSLWFDEASRELTHLNAVAIDDVSFGGFIAKVYEGTEAFVARQQIEPGVWMPTKLTLTGEFRALFRRARIDHFVEWFDYRMNP
jgi:multidrug efflux pump subunit AcrA (membrane-fusion protein)